GRVVLRIGLDERELLVRRHAAVAGARQGRVRAALAVREDRRAAARDVAVLALLAREGGVRLLLRELGIGDDVDLPSRQAVCEACVHALLPYREGQLVVRP